ncbi:MAG: thioredoxin domain-containing protein [Pseudomonadota bacterium]
MKKKIQIAALGLIVLIAAVGALRSQFSGKPAETSARESNEAINVPVKGMATMVDLGANECIPCKMMVPVMEKVEKKYQGKAAIIFIDVWKNKEPAKRFGIRAIPTQIFFDKEGKEVFRHEGFMGEDAIDRVFQKMGIT